MWNKIFSWHLILCLMIDHFWINGILMIFKFGIWSFRSDCFSLNYLVSLIIMILIFFFSLISKIQIIFSFIDMILINLVWSKWFWLIKMMIQIGSVGSVCFWIWCLIISVWWMRWCTRLRRSGATWRRWSGRTSTSWCGTSGAKRRCVPHGTLTTATLRLVQQPATQCNTATFLGSTTHSNTAMLRLVQQPATQYNTATLVRTATHSNAAMLKLVQQPATQCNTATLVSTATHSNRTGSR